MKIRLTRVHSYVSFYTIEIFYLLCYNIVCSVVLNEPIFLYKPNVFVSNPDNDINSRTDTTPHVKYAMNYNMRVRSILRSVINYTLFFFPRKSDKAVVFAIELLLGMLTSGPSRIIHNSHANMEFYPAG